MRAKEFYEFMIKRENIRLARERGEEWPWTDDPILQEYKFTNVKRDHDKTTMMLRELFYENPKFQSYSSRSHFLNCVVFRNIGRWETCSQLGYASELDTEYLRNTINGLLEKGKPVFTSAYMLPAYGDRDPKIDILIRRTLLPFWDEVDHFVEIIEQTQCWEPLFHAMRHINGFGGAQFMLKEILLDTMFTPLWAEGQPRDFNIYCPVGGGAERGLNRLMGREFKDRRIKFPQKLEEMKTLFELREQYWPKDFVELCLHDIQFQLCEWDKYERVRLGQGRPRNKYKQEIKKNDD